MRNCSTVRLGDCSLAKNPLTGTDAQKLLHKSERRKFQDELRHLKTRQGRFDAAMLHLDHPLPGTDLCLDPSDCGRSAAGMYDELEVVPLWLRLWRLAAAKLPPKGRAVLNALSVDWRNRPAGKMAGVDHKTVGCWKTKFKVHFAQCWRAYERDFAK